MGEIWTADRRKCNWKKVKKGALGGAALMGPSRVQNRKPSGPREVRGQCPRSQLRKAFQGEIVSSSKQQVEGATVERPLCLASRKLMQAILFSPLG